MELPAAESFLLLPLVALPLESFLLSLALLALVVSLVGWGFDGMMEMVWVRGRCFYNGVKQLKGQFQRNAAVLAVGGTQCQTSLLQQSPVTAW